MNKVQMMTREQAAFYLGITPYASVENVKRAYREKVKLYHPDSNMAENENAKEYFYLIQQAYKVMLTTPIPEMRPMRVFQTNQKAKTQFAKQKKAEQDREFQQQWEQRRRRKRREACYEMKKDAQKAVQLTKEEEILQKIRAIWLAETIHRQIEAEKEKTELENKRKLYRAFMQRQMQEENGEKWD